jgi:hypothetical protein
MTLNLDIGRRLLAGATPGPWQWRYESGSIGLWGKDGPGSPDHVLTPHVCEACEKSGESCLRPHETDEVLIVWLRNNAEALLAAAEERDRLREAVRILQDNWPKTIPAPMDAALSPSTAPAQDQEATR